MLGDASRILSRMGSCGNNTKREAQARGGYPSIYVFL
jgi:hypothetical protein